MPLKVFYTSIKGFLPHQLFHPSIHTTFRLTYETSKRNVRYMLKVIVGDTTKPLLKQL